MNLDDVVIEVTRKCNMQCPHCLRGDVENTTINIDYVRNLFSQVDNINMLTITGGEPSLASKKISEIVEVAREMNIEINSFYMVTNAKKVTPLFFKAIKDLFNYCSSNESSMVQVSNDGYHEFEQENFDKLAQKFSFYNTDFGNLISFKSHETGEEFTALAEGNATYNVNCDREVTINNFQIEEHDGEISVYGDAMIYLNAIGDVLPECNLSYESQREESLIMCSVKENNFLLIESIKEHNNKFNTEDEYASMAKSDMLYMELA